MTLTSIQTQPLVGFAGQPVGTPDYNRIKSMHNRRGNVAGVYTLTITQADSHAYTFTVNGVPIIYTSPASGSTEASIAAGLAASLAANQYADPLLSAHFSSPADLVLTERDPSLGAVAVAESDADLALATTTAHSAEEDIIAGRAVVRDTGADRSCRMPATGAVDFEGVAVFQQFPQFDDRLGAASEAKYPSGQEVPVLHAGVVLVEVEEAVAPGDAVYFRQTANGALTRLGLFRNDVDGGNCTLITGARFRTSASAGNLAELAFVQA